MFSESAALYDLIYATFKDYHAESAKLAALLAGSGQAFAPCSTSHVARPSTRDCLQSVTDCCGRHRSRPWFIEIARRKHPAGRFVVADMCDFDLGRRYDAVICLFSSIGYVRTLDRVPSDSRLPRPPRARRRDGRRTVVRPGVMQDGLRHVKLGESEWPTRRATRRTEIDGRLSRLHFEYDVTDHGRTRHATEVHELGLFTPEEMRSAFEANGLAVEHDPVRLDHGRGLYVARAQ